MRGRTEEPLNSSPSRRRLAFWTGRRTPHTSLAKEKSPSLRTASAGTAWPSPTKNAESKASPRSAPARKPARPRAIGPPTSWGVAQKEKPEDSRRRRIQTRCKRTQSANHAGARRCYLGRNGRESLADQGFPKLGAQKHLRRRLPLPGVVKLHDGGMNAQAARHFLQGVSQLLASVTTPRQGPSCSTARARRGWGYVRVALTS
jgi:hypothetical protein